MFFPSPISRRFQPHFHHKSTTIYHPKTTFCTPENRKTPSKNASPPRQKKSLKQTQLPRHLNPQMLISQSRSHPSPRRPVQKPNLNQKRLINLLQRILLLRQRRRQRIQPHPPPIVLLNNRPQQPSVQLIEPMRIHL